MSGIRIAKLVQAGVLAAIVVNVVDYLSNTFVLAGDWDHIARLHNLDPAAMGSTAAIAVYIVADVCYGFLIAWTYAAIRPRFGRGGRTATIAAFMVFLAEALLLATQTTSFFSWPIFLRTGSMLFVSVLAGALSGGWLYEQDNDEPT